MSTGLAVNDSQNRIGNAFITSSKTEALILDVPSSTGSTFLSVRTAGVGTLMSQTRPRKTHSKMLTSGQQTC